MGFITKLEFSCATQDEQPCPFHIQDNFNFYSRLFFSRDAPGSAEYYQQKYSAVHVIDKLHVILKKQPEALELGTIDESYEVRVSPAEKLIQVTAATSFGVSRAFASVMQLVQPDAVQAKDRSTYKIQATRIEDKPQYGWRYIGFDACSHWYSMADLRRAIDSASIQKLNALILTLGCAHSFPLLFKEAPQNRLAFGSWSPRHFYTMEDMTAIQRYAFQRGVVIVPQINVPGGSASWAHADSQLVADCRALGLQNPLNVVLNPLYEKTYAYIEGAVRETITAMFPSELGLNPVIHLGGEKIITQCWLNDKSITEHLRKNNITADDLWKDFQRKLNSIILSHSKLTVVYNQGALENGNDLSANGAISPVIHFTSSSRKDQALSSGYRTIHSTNMFANLMHPNGGHHYFWQDTWSDMTRQSVDEGCAADKAHLCVGGGVIQPGALCYAHSCEQHAYTRSFGVADALWAGKKAGWGNSRKLEGLGCYLSLLGIGNGPLEIGAPCLGYPFK